MAPKILQAKHWQIFLLTTGLPLVGMIITIIVTAAIAAQHRFTDKFPFEMFIPIGLMFVFVFTAAIIQLCWVWKTSVFLQELMNPEMRLLKIKRFKAFFFFPLIYVVFIFSLFPMLFSFGGPEEPEPRLGILIPFFILILMFLGNLFAAFCQVYVLYFTAKTFRSAEMQKEAHFSDYIGEFFLIWFFPVGVWLIQPRINRLISDRMNHLT